MSELARKYKEIYIPGVFDGLHSDHKAFILRCVDTALQNGCDFRRIVIGLASDKQANGKSELSPFYSFDWRKGDILRWAETTDYKNGVKVEQLGRKPIWQRKRDRLLVMSAEYEDAMSKTQQTLYEGVLFVPPIDVFHSSDIRRLLLQVAAGSNCQVRPVGAILLRNGLVQKISCNGDGPGSCESCPKYKSIMQNTTHTALLNNSDIPCHFSHAEINAMSNAKPGDYLLTTTSPCMDCAESIIENRIQRVVYINQYHDLKPIKYLKKSGVQIRQAGIQQR